ncbi:conjugal transfer protein TraF [Moritella sp.]|uniref:conjugal transfer protein TraF n=1 Tax=Moritella sp. TaxID=78556 RepID=UPI001D2BE219|nr:conjugal transfer protein TraF [Moritella sp.]MCJ8349174.1 conjugal transfer protein TraF [Moritella sp.]NQZ39462.1 conjugal transfer protein TraF [Moritella sp.]
MKIQLSQSLLLPLSLGIAVTSCQLSATEFDARSYAMGGVGVTTADYVTASFHNPAMAAKHDVRDDFGLLAPVLGIQFDDPNELFNDASNIYDVIANTNVSTDKAIVEAALTQLAGDKAYSEVGFGLVASVPTRYYSTNVFIKGYADAFLFADILDDDLNSDSNIDSKMSVYAISVVEFGMTFARKFDTRYGGMHFGISPKYNIISTYNYSQTIDNFDPDKYKYGASSDKKGFNLDLGMEVGLLYGLNAGAAVKNLIPQQVDLKPMNGSSASYNLHPVLTTGLSWRSDYATLAMDIDVNATQRYENVQSLSGVSDDFDDTQMLRIGGELSLPSAMQLRAGYTKDLQGNKAQVFTAGIGLSPFKVFHLDLGVSYGGSNKFGLVAQTMVWF